MAFGFISTNTLSGRTSNKARRKIFYDYPNGAAPLLGLLSLLPSEGTDKPEFSWFEKRFPTMRTNIAATGVAFATGAGGALTDSGTGVTLTADTEYRVTVVSTDQFKATHVIELRDIANQTTTVNIRGTVTEVVSSTVLKFRPYTTQNGVKNTAADQASATVAIIGNANPEGGRSGNGIISFPYEPSNYTQIFRTAYSISRTALKGGMTYDKDGPMKDLAKENCLRHMLELELAFLFGQKHTINVTDASTGETVPERKTGGVLWFLEQYEAANSPYRGGTGAPAITSNSDDDKRIIDLGGAFNATEYNTYISRAFRKTNDKAYEKVALCGGKFLEAVNSLFEGKIQRNAGITNKERNWEFIVHSHTTLRGTIHYKVHPKFDEDPDLQGACMILDMGNLHYRYLNDSDTTLLTGRQETDRDGRKDEWITEAGLELRYPESCMFLKNGNGIKS